MIETMNNNFCNMDASGFGLGHDDNDNIPTHGGNNQRQENHAAPSASMAGMTSNEWYLSTLGTSFLDSMPSTTQRNERLFMASSMDNGGNDLLNSNATSASAMMPQQQQYQYDMLPGYRNLPQPSDTLLMLSGQSNPDRITSDGMLWASRQTLDPYQTSLLSSTDLSNLAAMGSSTTHSIRPHTTATGTAPAPALANNYPSPLSNVGTIASCGDQDQQEHSDANFTLPMMSRGQSNTISELAGRPTLNPYQTSMLNSTDLSNLAAMGSSTTHSIGPHTTNATARAPAANNYPSSLSNVGTIASCGNQGQQEHSDANFTLPMMGGNNNTIGGTAFNSMQLKLAGRPTFDHFQTSLLHATNPANRTAMGSSATHSLGSHFALPAPTDNIFCPSKPISASSSDQCLREQPGTNHPMLGREQSNTTSELAGRPTLDPYQTSLLHATNPANRTAIGSSANSLGSHFALSAPTDNAFCPSKPISAPSSDRGLREQPDTNQPRSLFIPLDCTFLDPVNNFLRCNCIEVFVTTKEDLSPAGRGARPSKIGQVGLRCFYCKDIPKKMMVNQSVCYPSKRATIFESVRNFQRFHMEACPCIPEKTKIEFKNLTSQQYGVQKRPQKYMRAYFAEAASELGIVDTSNGLVFGAPPNKSGVPSQTLQSLIRAEEYPATAAAFWRSYSTVKEKATTLRKFEQVASESTKEVIINARKESAPFVYPEDFPTVSEFDFLLFHQVIPCKPSTAILKQKGIYFDQRPKLIGFCCKHCARAAKGTINYKGIYFPFDLNAFAESSFLQRLLKHFMDCPDVPQEVKDAFDELKRLASEHGVTPKRGSRKKFLKKIWARMEKQSSDSTK